MIHFEWPWLFLILPLPLLVRFLLPRADEVKEAALRVPGLEPFAMESASKPARLALRRGRTWLGALAWLLLVTAAARPIWVGDPIDLPVSGRDLMLAVDLSGSMQTRDFVIGDQRVSRLDAIKEIAGDFIDRRVGDRIGLILFGTQAYLQTPLTFDRKTVHNMLDEAAIGLAGEQTAIGDAIGLAVKRLRELPQGNKVLILLTDGVSNTGELTPLKAAQLAAKEGVTIYTIGIGASEMQVPSLFGMQSVNPSSDLDEDTLRAIARTTGGRYFRARDTEQLDQIYSILDKLQPVDQEKQTFRPRKTLFYWPLAISLLLLPVAGRR
ncbi:MAG TPA: VWA domain-containing protein [Sulfuriferula sp.]|nr:VWA domain-containing protein [Sulfuriferula sp.]